MTSFSLFGFRDALTFKSITDDIVNQLEQFIASDIVDMIERWQSEDPDLIIDKTAFFGVLHAHNPRSFKLAIGDRPQIVELVKHVQSVCDGTDPNMSVHLFVPKQNEGKNKRIIQPSENYFGFSRRTTNNASIETNSSLKLSLKSEPIGIISNEDLSKQLFDCVKKLLLKRKIKPTTVEKLRPDQFIVSVSNHRITGKFPCPLCKKSKTYTSQCAEKNGKMYWVLSNYLLHIKKHVVDTNDSTNEIEFDEQMEYVEDGNANANENLCTTDIKETLSTVEYTQFVEIVSENDEHGITDDIKSDDVESVHERTIELKIEKNVVPKYTEIMDYVSEIYKQISNQMSQMNEATLTKIEDEFDMYYTVNSSERTLKISQIPGFGDCLFGALSHQLYGGKIRSEEHNSSTNKIRADIVNHINQNYDSYEWALKGAVYNQVNGHVDNIEKACKDFLKNDLPNQFTWAGEESIRAAHEFFGVNILIINEKGNCYFQPSCFDKRLKQTIVLAFRLAAGLDNDAQYSNVDRNHYDSVVRMEQSDIYDIAKMLAAYAYNSDVTTGK